MYAICWVKFKLESRNIPRSLTESHVAILVFLMVTFKLGKLDIFCEVDIGMICVLDSFIIRRFWVNQESAAKRILFILFSASRTVVPEVIIVVSSAYCTVIPSVIVFGRSFI